MSRSPEITGQSYADILQNQGIDPGTIGPDDYFFTRRSVSGIDVEGLGEWYAIPRSLSVENPFTREVETGTLHENGAFVSDESEIADHGVRIDSRVVVLGASKIRDAHLHKGTVVHAAEVSDADVGQRIDFDIARHKNAVIHEGANVRGTPGSFSGSRGRIKPVWIGDGVIVGERASIGNETEIFPDCEIGAGAVVTDSLLLSGVKVVAPNPEDTTKTMRDKLREHMTFVGRSVVSDEAVISANAQIENSKIGRNAKIGVRADLENATVADDEVVAEGTVQVEKTLDIRWPHTAKISEAEDNNPISTSPAPRLIQRIGRRLKLSW